MVTLARTSPLCLQNHGESGETPYVVHNPMAFVKHAHGNTLWETRSRYGSGLSVLREGFFRSPRPRSPPLASGAGRAREVPRDAVGPSGTSAAPGAGAASGKHLM